MSDPTSALKSFKSFISILLALQHQQYRLDLSQWSHHF